MRSLTYFEELSSYTQSHQLQTQQYFNIPSKTYKSTKNQTFRKNSSTNLKLFSHSFYDFTTSLEMYCGLRLEATTLRKAVPVVQLKETCLSSVILLWFFHNGNLKTSHFCPFQLQKGDKIQALPPHTQKKIDKVKLITVDICFT